MEQMVAQELAEQMVLQELRELVEHQVHRP
jgi:hypothetical protein